MVTMIRIAHLKRQKFSFETKFLDNLNHYTRNHPYANNIMKRMKSYTRFYRNIDFDVRAASGRELKNNSLRSHFA